MAKPYAQDLRERRVRAGRAGQSRHAAVRSFDVGASCGIKFMRQFETNRMTVCKRFQRFHPAK
jgi:transposase